MSTLPVLPRITLPGKKPAWHSRYGVSLTRKRARSCSKRDSISRGFAALALPGCDLATIAHWHCSLASLQSGQSLPRAALP